MKALLLLLCAMMAPICIDARNVIDGKVWDEGGIPLSHAIVKATSGKTIKAFANTKADGSFSLAIEPDTDSLTITVDKLAFERLTLRVPNANQTLKLRMQPNTTQLREVVVSAPAVYQHGDTLRFNLAQFLGKGDVSLDEALRKVPGITVADNGKISYMGKDISNFYIEGLEMLGGNYALATRNLAAANVSSVEVLNNHNEAKMDKGKLSDKVALNVRLKRSTMFRPAGTSEASAGVGVSADKVTDKFLYALGTTGMMFTPKFQCTVSAKMGNIDEFALPHSGPVTVRGYGAESAVSGAEDVIGTLPASSPPLSSKRYLNVNDRLVSANSIFKTGKESTLRINASYAYHKQDNTSASSVDYYLGDDRWLTVNNEKFSCRHRHLPMLSAQYELNSDHMYFSNDFSSAADFNKIDMPVIADGSAVSQYEKFDKFKIADAVYLRFRIGHLEWHSTTDISWDKTPSLSLDISTTEGNILQEARSSRLKAVQRFGSTIRAGLSEWDISLKAEGSREKVATSLTRIGSQSDNDMLGHTFLFSATPSYQLTTRDKRMNVNARVDFKAVAISGDNRVGKGARLRFSHFYADPSVQFKYTATPSSKWTFSSSFNHTHGDLLTLLDNEVMHDYRRESANSGILARSSSFSTRGQYEYREPVNLWFAYLSASYSISKHNLMQGQYITDSSSSSSSIAADNNGQDFTLSGSASKNVMSIRSKFTLSSAYSINKRRIMQQNAPTEYYSTDAYVKASANVRPLSWIETDLAAEISFTESRFANVRNDYRTLNARLSLSFFPIDNLELKTNADYSDRQLSKNQYKRNLLWDFRATYKIKSLRIRLSANNIFNRRHYSYILYSGLDTYAYNYALRGREITLSLIFTK